MLCAKIVRHLTTKHKDETEIARALPFSKNSCEWKKCLAELRLKGDYHHNMKVLETGDGDLIVVRRPGEDKSCSIHDFLPCEFCLGFMKRWDLWKHQLSCEFKPSTSTETEAHVGKQQVTPVAPTKD
jgi:hypothetical protein